MWFSLKLMKIDTFSQLSPKIWSPNFMSAIIKEKTLWLQKGFIFPHFGRWKKAVISIYCRFWWRWANNDDHGRIRIMIWMMSNDITSWQPPYPLSSSHWSLPLVQWLFLLHHWRKKSIFNKSIHFDVTFYVANQTAIE